MTLVPEAHIDFASTVLDLSAARVLLDEFAPQTGYGGLHATAARYQLEQLERLASEPGPKLVIAHVLLPHAPYVFLEDGTYSPAEASLETQLAFTNARLRAWLEPLLALPEDERPIVILQADEGPYPDRYAADGDAFDWSTATPEEVTQKFGILTAMYLPGSPGVESVSPTMSPVNTFRYVLRRYFAADLPHLPDRSFTSSYERPYDLLEVSDRVVPPDDP